MARSVARNPSSRALPPFPNRQGFRGLARRIGQNICADACEVRVRFVIEDAAEEELVGGLENIGDIELDQGGGQVGDQVGEIERNHRDRMIQVS